MGREVFRLLVPAGQHLAGGTIRTTEAAILVGPPQMLMEQPEPDAGWAQLCISTWLRLAKLKQTGLALGASAAACLEGNFYPPIRSGSWRPTSDEFSHWMCGTGDPDYETAEMSMQLLPASGKALVQWLYKPARGRPFYEDTWREVCRSRFFHSLSALCDLAQNDVARWPGMAEALQAWAEDGWCCALGDTPHRWCRPCRYILQGLPWCDVVDGSRPNL